MLACIALSTTERENVIIHVLACKWPLTPHGLTRGWMIDTRTTHNACTNLCEHNNTSAYSLSVIHGHLPPKPTLKKPSSVSLLLSIFLVSFISFISCSCRCLVFGSLLFLSISFYYYV